MSRIREQLNQGAQWYNARPYRERTLILATLVIVILLAGWELAVAPVLKERERMQGQLLQAEQRQQDWQNQVELLTQRLRQDPAAELKERLVRRQERLAGLNQQLAAATDGLIAPEAMVLLLRNMLATQEGLDLVALELLPPVPVHSSAEAKAEGEEPLLYAHDVELVVSGRYLELLGYLERLEALDQRLGWSRLYYETGAFPKAEARVRVRTLGLSQAGLGV
ncbi:MSHA biogenesis protein MshJ [Marinobacter sp.]|uniref:MSHA biogenesis protein MshJ n=1 Tax=Marinobacter sp. TaxID=50741 RepID=UPI00384FA336